jgi:tryptophan-rich sensory protein
MVAKPPLAPPGFLFPFVWTILHIVMGISSYLIFGYDTNGDSKLSAIKSRCINYMLLGIMGTELFIQISLINTFNLIHLYLKFFGILGLRCDIIEQ